MTYTDISAILSDGKSYVGKTVDVAGWVRSARDSKNMAFLNINDIRDVQLYACTAGDLM